MCPRLLKKTKHFYHLLHFAGPLFVFQWQFDEAQMRADNVGAPATQAQWNFIHHQGRNLRTSLEGVANVFVPSCISHTVLTKPSWTEVTVDGVSLPDALQCWVEQDHPGERARRAEETRLQWPSLQRSETQCSGRCVTMTRDLGHTAIYLSPNCYR